MKKLTLWVLLISLSTSLFAEIDNDNLKFNNTIDETYSDSISSPTCYRFNKEDFHESLKIAEDVIVDYVVAEIDPEPTSMFLSFRFASSNQIPSVDFQCLISYHDNNTDSNYEEVCTGGNNEKIKFYIKDNAMYLHTEHLSLPLANKSITHYIYSKNTKLSKGLEVTCSPRKAQIRMMNVKGGSKKKKLLESININDVIIHNIDYNENVAIAVGEDNSLEDRLYRCQNGNHLRDPIVLRSTDNGKLWEKVKKEYWGVDYFNMASVIDKKNIIISGPSYNQTSIIFTSSDLGKSWKERASEKHKNIQE